MLRVCTKIFLITFGTTCSLQFHKVGCTLITKYAKTFAKWEKWKVYSGVFRATFFVFRTRGLAFVQKVKGFCSLFFHRINKTRNSCEIQKMYCECYAFCDVFCKNTREIPAKCEIRKVYSWPYNVKYLHCSHGLNKAFWGEARVVESEVLLTTPFSCNFLIFGWKSDF